MIELFGRVIPCNEDVAQLVGMQQTFILTGSRFFQTEKTGSDIDLMVERETDTKAQFVKMGFSVEETAYGEDPFGTLVMRKTTHQLQIDVQLVFDVKKKVKAQHLLYELGLGEALSDKNISPQLWAMAGAITNGFGYVADCVIKDVAVPILNAAHR